MFNLSGSEIVFILLAGLVVLGPDKLPGAIRQVGRIYSELRRMGQGFQDELRATLDEPTRELRETADLARSVLTKPLGEDGPDLTRVTPRSISASVQKALDDAGQDPPSAGETVSDETVSGETVSSESGSADAPSGPATVPHGVGTGSSPAAGSDGGSAHQPSGESGSGAARSDGEGTP